MTAEELAEVSGLSVEEARVVLEMRKKKENPASRLQKALEVLKLAEKKTGVKPYGE